MRPSIALLRDIELHKFSVIADSVTEAVEVMVKQVDNRKSRVDDFFTHSWTGTGSCAQLPQAIHAKINSFFTRIDTALEQCNQIADALRRIESELVGKQSQILAYVDHVPEGLRVDDTGVYHVIDGGDSKQFDRADKCTLEVRILLNEFDSLDHHGAMKLTTLMRGFDDITRGIVFDDSHCDPIVRHIQHGIISDIPRDAKAFRQWWDSLSIRDRELVFESDPSIGNHAGMDVADKDFFNRRYLDQLLCAHPHDVGLHALRRALAGKGEDGEHLFATFVDDKGHGAVTMGDSDYADFSVNYIPGTGQSLATINEGVGRAGNLYNAIQRKAKSRRVSVTALYNYDIPPELGEAMHKDRALAGAQAVDDFFSGQRATNRVSGRLFATGHSYGSTVLAAAASGGHTLDCDGMIFCGSPGVLVHHASDFSLTGIPHDQISSHVFATKFDTDPIPLFSHSTEIVEGTLGGGMIGGQGGAVIGGIIGFNHDGASGPLGVDPAEKGFGGTVFYAGHGHGKIEYSGYNPDDHTRYYNRRTVSLANIADIIVGLVPNEKD